MTKQQQKQEPELVRRDGGLCVAFVNTASSKRKSFSTYVELLAWGLKCGTVTGADVERLERAAAERPGDAAAVAHRALALRACFERVLKRLTRRQGPSDADVDTLHTELAAVRSAERYVRSGIGCHWVLGDRGGDDLDRMLWPVLMSMAEVLSTKYHLKVHQCAGEDCDLLFVDRTPGSPRRWCTMKSCGARIKSRRDYQRRVKPARVARKKRAARLSQEEVRRAREARERDTEEMSTLRAGKRPEPGVA